MQVLPGLCMVIRDRWRVTAACTTERQLYRDDIGVQGYVVRRQLAEEVAGVFGVSACTPTVSLARSTYRPIDRSVRNSMVPNQPERG